MDDVRRRGHGRSSLPRGPESPRLALAVRQHIGAAPPHALVVSVRSQLVEKDHLPDRPAILRGVAGAGFLPITFRMLGGEDCRYRITFHRRLTGTNHLGVVLWSIQQNAQGLVLSGWRVVPQ